MSYHYTPYEPPAQLTKAQKLRKEAFVMALQAMAAAGVKSTTTEEVVAEANRFYTWLNG